MPDTAHALLDAFESFAAKPALIDQRRALTFRELWEEADKVTGQLERQELHSGDRLAILLSASSEYVVLLLACIRMGVTACPLSTRLPEEGVRTALETFGAKALVVEEEAGDWGVSAVPLRRLWATADSEGAASGGRGVLGERGRPGEAGTIVFTSGSSGRPKAALVTLANHCANAVASNHNLPVRPGHRWLLSLPLYHVAGLGVVFRCLLGGGTIMVPEARESLSEAIERHGVTHVSLVPTQLHRLLREDAAALQGLKAILLGGSAASASLIKEAVAQKLPLYRTYGLTEMASQVTTTRLHEGAETLFSSGKPLAPDSVRIADDGEIQVRGEALFRGYVHGDAVERPLTPEGWFPTRDQGHFDESGNLVVTGRKDSLFISGGENIQPEEIEAALCGIEGVMQAVVVPAPDEEFGHRPVAFVETKGELVPEGLREQLARDLPGFKIPRTFLPWPEERKGPGVKPSRAAFTKRLKDVP